ncbi:hypothetical protein BVY02_00225 [bacterium J17]|nr:hypothetical protein BVY02_00225 [bacterium J17]
MKIFVTGTFRSGSTLLCHMLNGSSQLSITYDSVHFMRFAYQKYGKNKLCKTSALQLGNDMNQRLSERFNKGFSVDSYREQVEGLANISYSDLYDIIMRLYVDNENWGEKTVLEWRSAEDILELFDDMTMIHIIRDPRDVLASWKKETIAPGVDYLDALGNCFDSMLWAKRNKTRFGDRYLVLRYEDLVAKPHEELEKICTAIGVPCEDQMFDVASFKNKVTQERWSPNTAFEDSIDGISNAPVGRWKNRLENRELLLCEMVNRKPMKQFGYNLSGIFPDIKLAHSAFQLLKQSPLAEQGILNIVHFGEGVQRNPVNQFDPSTWETSPEKM